MDNTKQIKVSINHKPMIIDTLTATMLIRSSKNKYFDNSYVLRIQNPYKPNTKSKYYIPAHTVHSLLSLA